MRRILIAVLALTFCFSFLFVTGSVHAVTNQVQRPLVSCSRTGCNGVDVHAIGCDSGSYVAGGEAAFAYLG